jgi:hypothetical protein
MRWKNSMGDMKEKGLMRVFIGLENGAGKSR